MNALKARFRQLVPREQIIVFLLGVLLSWALFYGLAWSPLSDGISGYEAANEKSEETLDWMREATANLATGPAAQQAQPNESISSLIDKSLPEYKLVMQRYQPTADKAAQLWLEDAPLAQVIAWLVAMERDYGMRLVNVAIASSDKKGMVKTRVRLAKP